MSSTWDIRINVDADTKRRVMAALGTRGWTLSDAVENLVRKGADKPEIFDMLEESPNDEVLEAMAEMKVGKRKRFSSVEELMADLHADD